MQITKILLYIFIFLIMFTVSAPSFLLWGQPLVPNFEKGGSEKKYERLGGVGGGGGLKESLPQIFARGDLTIFLVKKDLKLKCGI